MYLTVKLNCWQPRQTEVKDYKELSDVEKIGPDYLVYECGTSRNLNGTLILLDYDYDTNKHVKPIT